MPNDNNNRVLSRMGARKLSQNEVEEVGAGLSAATLGSVLVTGPSSNPDLGLDA
jgi:hypothetical protein